MLQITPNTSPIEISEKIKILREQKGKEKETLAAINEALVYGHGFVINLFWEEALTYQHIFMNNPSDKWAMNKMEQAINEAKFYIDKYKLIGWKSRLYRFLGRISDYKGRYTESVRYYKKAVGCVKDDPEPFRILELKAFLSFALIMSGKSSVGYKTAAALFEKFNTTQIGKKLKKTDYQTWAIWRSGIVIRTTEAFLSRRLKLNKKEFENWINLTEKDLEMGDFSYRKMEIRALKQKLSKN